MVDGYEGILRENLTAEAANYGMSLEQLMSLAYGMDAESYAKEIRNQAVRYAKQSIMMQAIADKEGLMCRRKNWKRKWKRSWRIRHMDRWMN